MRTPESLMRAMPGERRRSARARPRRPPTAVRACSAIRCASADDRDHDRRGDQDDHDPEHEPDVQPVDALSRWHVTPPPRRDAAARPRERARAQRRARSARRRRAACTPPTALVGDRRARRGRERAGAREQPRPTAPRPTSASSASGDVMSPPDRGERDARRARSCRRRELDRRAGGDDRPVADAAVDLLVGAAGAVAQRDADLDQHLGRRRPRSRTARGGTRACRRRARRAEPRMTICAPTAAHTADRSSDGSAWHSAPPIVPRLRTTGSAITRSASVKIASRRASSVGLEQVAVARHRADPDLAVVLADVAELVGQRVDVDHVLGRGEAQLHHRQQASGRRRAAARPGPSSSSSVERVLDARGALVVERCWNLQDGPSLPRRSCIRPTLSSGRTLRCMVARQPRPKRSLRQTST